MDIKKINTTLDTVLETGGAIVSIGLLIVAGIIIGSVASE